MTSAKSVYPSSANTNAGAVARSAVAVKTARMPPGNQGARNSHTQSGKIKPVGTPAQMRQAQSITTTRTLAPIGEAKDDAHAKRIKRLYPSSGSVDTSRKL